MCTLIVAYKAFEDFPLVVAANRDEFLGRPSEPPAARDDKFGILAPRDLARGGTWIGVNRFGLFVGLTNRLDIRSQPDRFSRGEAVMRTLRHRSALEAMDYMAPLSKEKLNGFHMVIADKNHLCLVKGNGILMYRSLETKGVLVVTNHGVGKTINAHTPRRVANVLTAWEAGKFADSEPTPENLAPLLGIHDEERYGTCISEPENSYGTKSSSIIRLAGDKWEYWHRERPSPDRHVCEAVFGEKIELTINPWARLA